MKAKLTIKNEIAHPDKKSDLTLNVRFHSRRGKDTLWKPIDDSGVDIPLSKRGHLISHEAQDFENLPPEIQAQIMKTKSKSNTPYPRTRSTRGGDIEITF